jgi:glycosyltransferase involved in cell wall biosynthesis
MKIAVIARMLRRGKIEGIGMFARETLQRITKQHPEHQFAFLFDRPYDDEFTFSENVRPLILSFPARHPAQIAWWHQVSLKKYLQKNSHDILISPDGSIPLRSPVPTLAVIHDINFEHFPADLPFSFRHYYRYYYPKIAKAATRIVTVSEFSKSDIINRYNIDAGKIDVVYNAVGDSFRPIDGTMINTVRSRYSSGSPYFLFVGSIHQRKNIDGMIRAFDKFKENVPSDMKLIFAGAKRWWKKETEDAFHQSLYKNDIIFTGRVSDEQLTELIGSALALVLASKFEGFGIPILEAMKCGVPVITSDVTAMPEIAGDAALLVDPFSTDSISEAMRKIFQDDSLRQSLISKGIERAKKFTWDESATQLWKSVERILAK